MDDRDRALAQLASTQLAVASTAQALALGFTPAALRHRVERGALERVGAKCLRVAGAPESWRQLLRVGLLDLGDDALVAGRSAAALLGLDGFGEGPLEFAVPRGKRNRITVGAVRSLHAVGLIDRTDVDGFAAMSAARCIIDLAGSVTEQELERAVDSALRLGLASEPFLRWRFQKLRYPGLRGATMLDRVLEGSGTHSRLERTFLALVRRARLPRPTCQRIYRDGGRFVARTDFAFEPLARVIVEVAGHATHATRRQRQRDAQRHTELQLLGYLVLTFTYEDVVERPAWVLSMVRAALQAAAA